MIRLVMPRGLLAILLSIPLAFAGAAGVFLHVCHSMGGVVVAGCDCEKQDGHEAHAGHGDHAARHAPVQLKTQPCCTMELSNASQPIATQEAGPVQVDEAQLAVVGLVGFSLVTSRQTCDLGLYRERGPPNVHGPPIFIRNCSFLN